MSTLLTGSEAEGARVVVALDIEGTTLVSGLVTADGTVLHSAARPAVRDGRRDPDLVGTVTVAREMTEAAAAIRAEVVGIGAGFPEYLDATGKLTSCEVLDRSVQPADLLDPLVPARPVAVESDMRCGALTEARFGRGRGLGSFLYVSLGTGLSAAFAQGGRVWEGHRGEAVALGHWEVPASVDPEFSAAPGAPASAGTRYTGLPKTHLGHIFAATAINIIRLDAWPSETPLGQTRTSYLARLQLAAWPQDHTGRFTHFPTDSFRAGSRSQSRSFHHQVMEGSGGGSGSSLEGVSVV
ncbi:ROK family protein (plasmid) [Streptomyces sp. NBC_01717]|uniref:ROK family protein n=1 Tax=Streptomyces sp. NBC_01717 TaxID=2975918 RepID=UPI002E2FFB96|nr:ROK family protein [Streptomyces sp. NBC_01717]